MKAKHATEWMCVGLLAIGLALLWWFDPAETGVPLCGFHAMTGLWCPGCGTLRATHELLHGHFFAAVRDNVLWTLSLPLTVYLAISEFRASRGRDRLPGGVVTHRLWFWIVVAIVAVVFGVLRNLPGEPWSWLAPPR